MTIPHHHDHRTPVSISPSILRMSAWERLAAGAVLIAALWVAVLWAL